LLISELISHSPVIHKDVFLIKPSPLPTCIRTITTRNIKIMCKVDIKRLQEACLITDRLET